MVQEKTTQKKGTHTYVYVLQLRVQYLCTLFFVSFLFKALGVKLSNTITVYKKKKIDPPLYLNKREQHKTKCNTYVYVPYLLMFSVKNNFLGWCGWVRRWYFQYLHFIPIVGV